MSRVKPLTVLAIAAVAAVAVSAVLLIGTSAPPSRAEQADAIARELRCPDCQGLSVADSPTASAAEIRRQIASLLASGEDADGVREHFVDRYGEWILLAPSAPTWWIAPFAVVLVGVVLLGLWLMRGRRAPPGSPAGAPPDRSQRARIREDVEALDA